MGMTFRYRDERQLELQDIRDVLARGAANAGFHGFDPATAHDGFFERATLEALDDLPGIQLGSVVVEGRVSGKTPLDDLRDVLRRGAETVGTIGCLGVAVSFEERGERQRKNSASTAGVWVIAGATEFHYSAGRSKVLTDRAYRKGFMRRIADSALLPLAFQDEGEAFRLGHTEGGRIRTPCVELGGTNPTAFCLATPGRSGVDQVEVLAGFLDAFGSGRRFEHTWRVHPQYGGRSPYQIDESPALFGAVVRAGFPADRHTIQVAFTMADIGGIDTLRSLCGPKDEIMLTLGSLDGVADRQVHLDVVTTADGHRIEATCGVPLDPGTVGARLGLQLSEVD